MINDLCKKISCPICGTINNVFGFGNVDCNKCGLKFNIDEKFNLIGKGITCPYCRKRLYITESGKQICSSCNEDIFINFDLDVEPPQTLIGDKRRCFCCGQIFYVSEIGQVDCNGCRFEVI